MLGVFDPAFPEIGVLFIRRLHTDKREKTNLTFDAMLPLIVCGCHAARSENLVHLLESATLGLGNQENDIYDRNGRDASEKDECTKVASLKEGRRSSTDCEVV